MVTFEVPEDAVGHIIGKNGRNMNLLETIPGVLSVKFRDRHTTIEVILQGHFSKTDALTHEREIVLPLLSIAKKNVPHAKKNKPQSDESSTEAKGDRRRKMAMDKQKKWEELVRA
jgi:hypothetical protein